MIRRRRAIVTALGEARPGANELLVRIGDAAVDEAALAFPELVGEVTVGDEVLLNTTAVALGLGTGGVHLVMAVLRADHPDGASQDEEDEDDEPIPGRVMKARYTPMQTAVSSVEETHREALEASRGLDGTPVVCAPLHSMIGPAAAGAKVAGRARVVYVMTDGAALPGPFSRLVLALRDAGLLDGWITCGQAFGGELEAVTPWSAMLAAKEVLDAEVIVVADGPGNLGTDTTWGVSALAGGDTMNAAAALGGRPVPALRVSFADPRERHRGLSHHSLTILDRICRVETNVPVPALPDGAEREAVWGALQVLAGRHQLVEVEGRPALQELARRGVEVTSMGRGMEDDPAFFLAAGAAGILAGRMVAGDRSWRSADPSS
jgi:hypothetical protein